MIAARRPELASGAAMLLVANVACVNLAAQLVFIAKGIRPRLWHEQKSARKAVVVNLMAWITLWRFSLASSRSGNREGRRHPLALPEKAGGRARD
jgi:uncharacterized membrane protein